MLQGVEYSSLVFKFYYEKNCKLAGSIKTPQRPCTFQPVSVNDDVLQCCAQCEKQVINTAVLTQVTHCFWLVGVRGSNSDLRCYGRSQERWSQGQCFDSVVKLPPVISIPCGH